MASVDVLVDGTVVANDSDGSIVLTAPSASGAFTVSVVGLDGSGAPVGASDAVTLVAADAVPVVNITAPAANSPFDVGTTVAVTYTTVNVASVRVSVDGVVVGNSTGGTVSVTAPATAGAFVDHVSSDSMRPATL